MSQMELFPDGQSGRTSQELSLQTMEEILQRSSMKWQKQGRISKNTLCWMHSFSESPNEEDAFSSSLAGILQPPQSVQTRYYLSPKACQGILRRANRRGKVLPERLQKALEMRAALMPPSENEEVNGGMEDK